VGCWLLAVGCWLLAVGCWLLAVGCWLLLTVKAMSLVRTCEVSMFGLPCQSPSLQIGFIA
ncbi:hypothetical protein ACUVJH_16995, partial [Aeromonas veronii]|uniref:hypothetical protein n=1 Tax=Aeromonas veronii TaxID=654 RepID=UPI004055892E